MFATLALCGVVLSFNDAAVAAVVPSIAKSFGIDEFAAARTVWCYMLPYGLAALVYGPLARSVESKRILLVSLAVLCAAHGLAGTASRIEALYLARAVAGVAGAAVIPLALIIIARHTRPDARGTQVGRFFSFTFLASLAGQFLSGVISWRLLFVLPALAAVPALAMVWRFVPGVLTRRETFRLRYRESCADHTVIKLFCYIFAVSVLFHGIRQWLGVYFSLVSHLEQFLISMLLTTISISGMIGESLGGLLSDRIGRLKVINTGTGLMIVAAFSLLLQGGVGLLFVLMFVWGLGWTFNHVGVSTALTDLPKEHLFESASLNSSVRFLAGGLGVVAGGTLMEHSFALGFSVFGVGLVLLLLVGKKLIVAPQEA